MWLPGHLTSFTGGMALAVLSVVGTRWNACATLPLAAALYFAVATPIGGVIVGTVPAWVPVTKECLYAAIAMLVVGTVVLGSPNRYTRILSSPPVVWLGEISYEIFLLHTVVMAVVMNLVLRWPLFTGSLPGLYVTTLAVTIPLAVLLHRFTRIDRRLRPAPAARALARPAPVRDATPRPSPPASIQPQFASSLRG
jgi:peptidoglycan/LPS O-acetylase OafA/YrhL